MNNVKTISKFENAKLQNLAAVKGGGWTMEDLVIPKANTAAGTSN